MYSIYSILHPEVYHGHNQKAPYFEGWYYRLVSADETKRYAVIPGVILGKDAHSFVQVLDGVRASTSYHRYQLDEFEAARREFTVRIGESSFNLGGFALNISTPAGKAAGRIQIGKATPWPVTAVSPGIMGWYAWVPGMECYHGVLSFDHALSGHLEIDGELVDFSGGRGYIEKDWGKAFPEGYIWMQTNHFDEPETCLTLSVAIIPWGGSAFPGFIVGLWREGTLHRFATYTGARLERMEIDDERVVLALRDGKHRLEVEAERAAAGFLRGPSTLDMGRRVDETMNARLAVRLSRIEGGMLYDLKGRHAGLEVFQPQKLLRMIKTG